MEAMPLGKKDGFNSRRDFSHVDRVVFYISPCRAGDIPRSQDSLPGFRNLPRKPPISPKRIPREHDIIPFVHGRQFVQEEYPVMGQTHLPRLWILLFCL